MSPSSPFCTPDIYPKCGNKKSHPLMADGFETIIKMNTMNDLLLPVSMARSA